MEDVMREMRERVAAGAAVVAGLAFGAGAVVVLAACSGVLFVAGQAQELLGGAPRRPSLDADRAAQRDAGREARKRARREAALFDVAVCNTRAMVAKTKLHLVKTRSACFEAADLRGGVRLNRAEQKRIADARRLVRDAELHYAIACATSAERRAAFAAALEKFERDERQPVMFVKVVPAGEPHVRKASLQQEDRDGWRRAMSCPRGGACPTAGCSCRRMN